MQLIGAVVAVVVLAIAAPARAQTAFESKVQLYVDDDHTDAVAARRVTDRAEGESGTGCGQLRPVGDVIEHHGALYRLKITRQGKLILNK